jgi:hypothetical protein
MLRKRQLNAIEEDADDDVEYNDEKVDAIDEYHPDNTGFFC